MKIESHQPDRHGKKHARRALLVITLIVAVFFLLDWLVFHILIVKPMQDKDKPTLHTPHREHQLTSPADADPVRPAPDESPPDAPAETDRTDPPDKPVEQPDAPAPGPKGMTRTLANAIGPSPITLPPPPAEQARKAFQQGIKLFAQDKNLLDARRLLNLACRGKLPEPQAVQARKALENLAERTVLKRDSYVNPNDPYLLSYTFQSGDRLNSIRRGGRVTRKGVIARKELNTPAGIIVWVNGLSSARRFQAGRAYKLLEGPFHLVVYKQARAADLYLQDLFVRRMPVCIGAPETPTPEGYFRVVPGGKTAHSTYYPPAETGRPNIAIRPGQPDYPLGPKGLNIKIEGIPQLGTTITVSQSYAIHGTNEPQTIGTPASRGCLRFSAEDIQLLFDTLIDYADPTNPSVTWNRWSTITIRP
jgi:hypothetical protein